MSGFTFDDIPDQTGRTALVTGANTGIGFHIAEMLAKNGAKVLMGCRNRDKAESARQDLLKLAPGADVDSHTRCPPVDSSLVLREVLRHG